MKRFSEWNEVKIRTESKKETIFFKEREIYWANIGENIGFEQDGKGKDFMRPILIFRKYNNRLFLGIPLSTQPRNGSFFFNFQFVNTKESCALLVQARTYDVKRLDRKIGMINKNDFMSLENKMKNLIRI
jgi:mRNA interferase MazF